MKLLPVLLFSAASTLAVGQSPMFFQTSYSTSQVSAPVFSPISPYTGGATTVTISVATPASGATINYCTGTSACTPGSTYSSGITFNSSSTFAYICAQGTASGYLASAVACWKGTYVLSMSVVQQVACGAYASSSSSFSCSLSATLSGDSLLVACLTAHSSVSFSQAASAIGAFVAVGGNYAGVWDIAGVTAGTTTLTVTVGAYGATECEVAEVTNLLTSSSVDAATTIVQGGTYGTGSATNTTGSVTTSNAVDAIIGVVMSTTSEAYTAGTGYTAVGTATGSSGFNVFMEYQNESSTGTYNPGATWTPGMYPVIATGALKL